MPKKPRVGRRSPKTGESGGQAATSEAAQAMARLANVPFGLVIVDLADLRILAANSATEEQFGVPPGALAGRFALDFVVPEEREAARQLAADVQAGRLEGWRVHRTFLHSQGGPIPGQTWARRLSETSDPAIFLLAIIPDEGHHVEASSAGVVVADSSASLMVVTDHDWLVEFASADSRDVIGVGARRLIGTPLLGIVHPGDAPDFLFAVERTTSSRNAVVCRVRLRARDGTWQDTTCFVHLLCDHSPPRVGVMAVRVGDGERPAEKRVTELERALQRIAVEARDAGVLEDIPELLNQVGSERMAGLSSRQWEILNRLGRGETAPKIAAAMYVSPSSIRNQLVAIYRRFGVHSQIELMSLISGRTGPGRPGSLDVRQID